MISRAIGAIVVTLALATTIAACRRDAPGASLELDARITAAVTLLQTTGPRAALPAFEQLVAAARAAHDRRREALLLGYIGTAHKRLSDYRQAMAFHEQALALKRAIGDEVEIGKTLSNMGLVEDARGDCSRALALYAQSLAIFERLDQPRFAASVMNNQGLCYDALGEFGKSVPAYERALEMQRHAGNDLGESEALGNLGGVALQLGRYPEAMDRYAHSLAISRRLDARQSMVLDLINLGLARLGTGARASARADLEQARTLAHDAGLLREEADAARGLSTWLREAGQYDEARKALDDAASIYGGAGLAREGIDARLALGGLDLETGDIAAAASAFARASDDARSLRYFGGELSAQLSIGELELRRHNPVVALAALDRAYALASSAGDHADRAVALESKARVFLDRGDTAASVAAARQALVEAAPVQASAAWTGAQLVLGDSLLAAGRPADARAAFDAAERSRPAADIPELTWRAAYGRARAFEAEGRLDDALASCLRAVDVIEQVRSQLSSARARTGFLDSKRDVYTAAVRLLLRLGRTRDAFEAAERLRAQAYRELLQRSLVLSAGGDSGVPAPLLARIRHLQSAIDDELRHPAAEQRGAALATYQEELRAADAAWQAAVDAASSRAGWARAITTGPASAAAVQQRLPARTALVEYVVDMDHTAAFVLTRGRLHALALQPGARELRNRIELLRGLLGRHDGTGWQPVAERLDLELLTPLRQRGWLDGITRLYVVPHAELNYLPFALLRHAGPTGPRYLVDDVATVWLPAASALLPGRDSRPRGRGLLALAPGRARLPFAREEVEAVARLFPASPEVLAGDTATEARFKHDAGGFSVIHLATHGVFNRTNPLFSGLELEAGGNEDGQLQVFEILGLRLGAELVALSACDTAMVGGELTDFPAGEELVGLARAFLSAGAHHVLATLWAINDRSTAALMTEFYGAARHDALPEALADVQRRRAHAAGPDADPWSWAPFVIAAGGHAAETALVRP